MTPAARDVHLVTAKYTCATCGLNFSPWALDVSLSDPPVVRCRPCRARAQRGGIPRPPDVFDKAAATAERRGHRRAARRFRAAAEAIRFRLAQLPLFASRVA